jgi:hypothetical protein
MYSFTSTYGTYGGLSPQCNYTSISYGAYSQLLQSYRPNNIHTDYPGPNTTLQLAVVTSCVNIGCFMIPFR